MDVDTDECDAVSDKSSLPTLESLERGLLNDTEEDVEDFMSLVMHLLRIAIDDVGVPNPKEVGMLILFHFQKK